MARYISWSTRSTVVLPVYTEHLALAHGAMFCQPSFPKAAGRPLLLTCLLRQNEGGASGVEIPCEDL